ncbi:hypothetical protein PCANB_000368 [Pneumocystis canis]|nr:hypothetical protein PCK1_000261 [Pneumocystis canis]KAG5438021.1 hypothetical protein PCANB_000368 [Pneumocystis canis]
MSVECKNHLEFCRPLTSMVKVSLFLYNPHKDAIVFKIKTTAPKQYCVRPNSGRIEAGQKIEVLVLLQALKEEPPLDFKCRDKFLIQSIVLTDQNTVDTQSLLSLFDSVAKENIHEKKIKCVFTSPEQDTTTQYTSEKCINDYEKYGSVRSPETHDYNTDLVTKPVLNSNRSSPNDDAPSNRASGDSESNENLTVQLIEAKTMIKKLKDQLKESEQRCYNDQYKSEKRECPFSGKAIIATAPRSVPIHMCILFCLLAFFLAYFAF